MTIFLENKKEAEAKEGRMKIWFEEKPRKIKVATKFPKKFHCREREPDVSKVSLF